MNDPSNSIEKALVGIQRGLIRVDSAGAVWRIAVNKRGMAQPIQPRRAEVRLNNGYLGVVVRFDGRQFLVLAHRLVWTVLRSEIPPTIDINHLNGDKHDNSPENLELATRGQNHRHAYRTGLRKVRHAISPERRNALAPAAKSLRQLGASFREVGRTLGVSQTTAFRLASWLPNDFPPACAGLENNPPPGRANIIPIKNPGCPKAPNADRAGVTLQEA